MSGQTNQACESYIRNNIASNLQNCKLQNRLLIGNTLKQFTPSWQFSCQWLREMNSGKGKAKLMSCESNKMGNPHAFGRQRLNDDWLGNTLSQLKVQSSLQGNLKGYTDGWSCLLQLESYLYWLLQDLLCSFNFLMIIHNKNEFTIFVA
jgi:hypothetical protein